MTKPKRYLPMNAAAERYGKSLNTIWRWVREIPDFPKPIKIGAAKMLDMDELEAYEAKQRERASA